MVLSVTETENAGGKAALGRKVCTIFQHDEFEVSMGHTQVDVSSGQSDLSLKSSIWGSSITEDCGIRFQKGRDPYLTYYFGGSVDKFVIPSGLYFLGLLGHGCLFSLTFP